MSQIKNLMRNYKYSRESASNDTVENQTPSLVTEDQFNTVKAFIDSNKATVDKILTIDESTLSEERLSRVKAIKMVMENNGSYEKYLNNNVGNQESANQVYKTEERNTSEAVGLANYELDHDSKQKTALIERVKNLRGLKSNPDTAFSSIQQLQLEVAERLLGPQTVAAEFDRPNDLFEKQSASPVKKEVPKYSKYDLEKRDSRRDAKLYAMSGKSGGYTYGPNSLYSVNSHDGYVDKSSKIRSEKNAAGEGFVLNPYDTIQGADQEIQNDVERNVERLCKLDSEIIQIEKQIAQNESYIIQNEQKIKEIQDSINSKNTELSQIVDSRFGFNKGKNTELRSNLQKEISVLEKEKTSFKDTKANNEKGIEFYKDRKKNRVDIIVIATEVQKKLTKAGVSEGFHYEVEGMIRKAGARNDQIEEVEKIIYDKKTSDNNSKLNSSSFSKIHFETKKAFKDAAGD